MQWEEVRVAYPDQWLLIEAVIAAKTPDGKRRLEQIEVVEQCNDAKAALRCFRQYRQEQPQKEFYYVHTGSASLDARVRQQNRLSRLLAPRRSPSLARQSHWFFFLLGSAAFVVGLMTARPLDAQSTAVWPALLLLGSFAAGWLLYVPSKTKALRGWKAVLYWFMILLVFAAAFLQIFPPNEIVKTAANAVILLIVSGNSFRESGEREREYRNGQTL